MQTVTEEATGTRAEVAALLHEQLSRLNRELRTLDAPHHISQERLSALSIVDRRGPISMSALADHEMVSPATMSRMVSLLVNDGLVTRGTDKDDARGVLVTITPKGRRTYHREREQRVRHFAQALAHLNKEELVAIRALAAHLERFTLTIVEGSEDPDRGK